MLKRGIKLSFFLALFLSKALATEISSVQNTTEEPSINEDLTITTSGEINVSSNSTIRAIRTSTDYNANIVNNGEVKANSSDGNPYGIQIQGVLGGTISNNSLISGTSNNLTNYSNAYAIGISNNLTGTLTNSGTLLGSSTSQTSYAYAYGIDLANMISTNLNNSGLINAQANSPTRFAYAYALDIDDITNNSTLNSTGSIIANSVALDNARAYGLSIDSLDSTSTINLNDVTASATSSTRLADTYGVHFLDGMEGNLNLNGQMNISSKGFTETEAYGVYRTDDNPNPGHFDGNLNHSGTSNISSSSSSDAAIATFFYIVNGNLNGTFENSGTILVSSTAIDESSRARGLYIDGDVNNTITNTGTISTSSNNTNENSESYGMQITGTTSASITNSGKIESLGTSVNDYSQTRGIYLRDISNTTITNSGFIISSANSSSRYAQAYGIATSDVVNSSIVSSGSILASAISDDSYTRAYGIQLYSSGGTSLDATSSLVVNDITAIANGDSGSRSESNGLRLIDTVEGTVVLNGTINSSARGSASSDAYGVNISTLNGTFTNNGVINTSIGDLGDATAIKVTDGTGTITNSVGAILNGGIETGGTVVVNNSGTWNLRSKDNATIANNYNQNAGADISFTLKDTMTYSTLNVTGTANLDANSKINITTDSSSTLKLGDSFTDIVSAGTLNNSIIKAGDSSILLDYDLVQDANTLDLTIKQGVSVKDILSDSNKEFANYWDNLIKDGTSNSDLNSILSSLFLMSNKEEVANALENNLPYGSLASMSALGKLNSSVNSIVSSRQTQTGVSSGDEVKNQNLWIKPFYSKASQDNKKSYGYEADTYGFVLGYDKELNLNNRLGLALSYANSDIEVNNLDSNTKVDSYLAKLYGTSILFDNKTFLDWQVGFGFHKNESDTKHSINNSNAKADYYSISSQVSAKLSKHYGFTNNSLFTPFVKATYMYQKNDSYKQGGAGILNMKVDSSNSDKFLLGLGGLYDYEINSLWNIGTKLALNYNLLNDANSITSSYAADSSVSFTTKGIKEQALSYEFALSSKYEQSENLNIYFVYDLEGSSGFTNNSLSLKLNWLF